LETIKEKKSMIEPFDEEEYNEKVMKLKQIPLSKSKTIIELQKSA
jgi:hypothetical protein